MCRAFSRFPVRGFADRGGCLTKVRARREPCRRALIPERAGRLVEPTDVAVAQPVLGPKGEDPPLQPVHAEHPSAVPAQLLAAEPGARLHLVERQADRGLWLSVVAGQPFPHPVAELGHDLQVVQRPGTVARADQEHAGRADDEERDPTTVDAHVALNEPEPFGKRSPAMRASAAPSRRPLSSARASGASVPGRSRASSGSGDSATGSQGSDASSLSGFGAGAGVRMAGPVPGSSPSAWGRARTRGCQRAKARTTTPAKTSRTARPRITSTGASAPVTGSEATSISMRASYHRARLRARLAEARRAFSRVRSLRRHSVSVVLTRHVVVTQRPFCAASGSASVSPITR